MKNNENYYTNCKEYFDAIKLYAKEISGTVLSADLVRDGGCYFGFIVYYENIINEDEKAKHFLINCKYITECDVSILEALQTNDGKRKLAKALSYNGSFVDVFLKQHEGYNAN